MVSKVSSASCIKNQLIGIYFLNVFLVPGGPPEKSGFLSGSSYPIYSEKQPGVVCRSGIRRDQHLRVAVEYRLLQSPAEVLPLSIYPSSRKSFKKDEQDMLRTVVEVSTNT